MLSTIPLPIVARIVLVKEYGYVNCLTVVKLSNNGLKVISCAISLACCTASSSSLVRLEESAMMVMILHSSASVQVNPWLHSYSQGVLNFPP